MTLQVGYAISRASYKQCKIDSSAEIKNEIILQNGLLDTASDYLVISCEEWDSITSVHSYDKEIPVGKINIKITININEITKEFSVSAGDILFDIIKIVMYTERMTEDEFRDEFRYEITPDIQLNEKLVRAGTENVSINIFEKNKKNRKSKEDCMPVEFRNVGLTCYMNTALQVLLGVGELSNAIEEMTRDEINEYAQREDTKKGYTREKCGNLLNAYRELIKTVRKKKDCHSKLSEMKRAIGSIDTRYRGCIEEDAGEVFSLILTNFNYLFQKTRHENLIPDLFMYSAESVRVFKEGEEVVNKCIKPLYKSFVLNGSFGSEGGPHSHILVMHKNQLVVTALCIPAAQNTIQNIKERISNSFHVEAERIACIFVSDGRVERVSDDQILVSKRSLLDQPIFYITDEDIENIEFLFISYTATVEGLAFFTSLLSGVKNVFQIPFLVKKKCNIAQFLERELKIKRRDIPNTILDIQQNRESTERHFGSMVIALSNKYWDAAEHIDIIKNRKYDMKDCVHVQCVVSNWETTSARERTSEDKEDFLFDRVEESTKFRKFSKYFCVQLPIGLGKPFKGDKSERQKLLVEKDGLVLDGVVYSLVGILVHHSFGIGGHYVAFTKRNNTWYHCNDSTITKSSVNEAISTGYPYGILYRRSDSYAC
ncbi:hypothetical protein NEAUS03_0320 [Nematocida ausubeli]|nr:hypothetical protein NEAUS03_0320 [Nematocida ausubeli]